jgi:hypothetical protein
VAPRGFVTLTVALASRAACDWDLALQKFLHKLQLPGRADGASTSSSQAPHPAAWLVDWAETRTVEGSGGRLLCSGWWSLSRHVSAAGPVLSVPSYACRARARAHGADSRLRLRVSVGELLR